MEKTKRLFHLDLLKTQNIICMVLCHTVMRLASHRPGFEGEPGYILGDSVLGCVFAAAYTFMFSMGICFIFSKKNTPKHLLVRGICIYILGYVLNLFRFVIYAFLDRFLYLVYDPTLFKAVFFQDIFQFAGLAMILTAFFRKIKLNEVWIFLISVVLSVIGSITPDIRTGKRLLDVFFGTFVTATEVPSHFTLFNWYIFVAAGMLFGRILTGVKNEKRLYAVLLAVSGVITAAFGASTQIFGLLFMNKFHRYYSVVFFEAVGYLSISIFLLSLYYFVVKKLGPGKCGPFVTVSRNMTVIFFIHWCLICFVEYILCYILGLILPYPVIYLTGAAIFAVSLCIAMAVNKRFFAGKNAVKEKVCRD